MAESSDKVKLLLQAIVEAYYNKNFKSNIFIAENCYAYCYI